MPKKTISNKIFEDVFYTVPIGLFIVDQQAKITAWNKWMENNTDIDEIDALDKTLHSLFPEEKFLRYDWALEQVLNYSNPQFMSQALNKYLVPSKLKDELGFEGLDYMQQTAELYPIKKNNTTFALVVIQDATMKSHQQNTLLNMAKRFETESLFDELTGIYNRKYISTWVDFEMKKAVKAGKNLACSLFDLDHFKKINDTYGHKAGDDVLVSFANVVKSTLRDEDLFARYGGEEFIVFSPLKPQDDPTCLAERIRKKLASVKTHGQVDLQVTCSVGVSLWQSAIEPIIEVKTLIDKADKVLYEAKNSGRDKVIFYNKD